MAAAGCTGIFFGIETGSPRMQKIIRKKLSLQQVKTVINETHSLGMHVTTSFIIGFPQEQKEDLSNTINMARELISMGVNAVQVYLLSPLPGSELYRTFGNTLQHDGQWSDLSFRCLTPGERKLIADWPAIFTVFYHYDTPYLNYDLLRSLSLVFNIYPR
jgi:radical SAM superfamily enzyme YgiQ (UPF0313 family)